MRNLIFLVLIVCVSVLVSGCGESDEARNARIIEETNFPPGALAKLNSELDKLNQGLYPSYRIIRITQPSHPEIFREGIQTFAESTDIWCIEISYGPGSAHPDMESYVAKVDDEYIWTRVLAGEGGRGSDEMWTYFGCDED